MGLLCNRPGIKKIHQLKYTGFYAKFKLTFLFIFTEPFLLYTAQSLTEGEFDDERPAMTLKKAKDQIFASLLGSYILHYLCQPYDDLPFCIQVTS